MAAGEEIDLTGLDKQITDVQNDIKKLGREFEISTKYIQEFGDSAAQEGLVTFKDTISAISKALSDMKNNIKKGDFNGIAEGLSKAIGDLQKLDTEQNSFGLTNIIDHLGKMQSMLAQTGADYITMLENAYTAAMKNVDSEKEISTYTIESADAAQKQAKAQEQAAETAKSLADSKKKEADLSAKNTNLISEAQKRQQQLIDNVKKGNQSAIASYIKQEQSIERLGEALQYVRAAQAKCNQSTDEGRKKYEELDAVGNKIEKTIDRINGRGSVLNTVFEKTKVLSSQIATSFGVMTGVFGATRFVQSLYKITSQFQLQQRALAAIIANAREANILFKQMQSLAVNSPMKLMDLNKYTKQLAAYRIETNNLYDSLKMLGDIAVGVGVDMDRLILAYGQVKAANYLRGQELRQFSEAGVNILGGLQEYYKTTKGINLTINEIFDSVSKRKVLFEDVDAVLKRMTQSGGTFYNMQLIQSQTLYGQMQKLGDLLQINMNKLGKSTSGILLGVVKVIQVIIKNLNVVVGLIAAIGTYKGIYTLVRGFQKAALVSKELAEALKMARVQSVLLAKGQWKQLITNIRASTVAAQQFRAAIVGVGAAIFTAAISAAISAYGKYKERVEETANELNELYKRTKDIKAIDDIFYDPHDKSYKNRLIALQQLIEKAKEYNYYMAIDEHIDQSNINETYERLSKNLKEYVKDVQYWTAALSNEKIDKQIEKFGNLMPDFALAEENAKRMLNFYAENKDNLAKSEKEIYDQLLKMQKDFAQNESKAVEDYKMTSEQFRVYVVKRVNDINKAIAERSRYDMGATSLWANLRKAVGTADSDISNFIKKYDKRLETIKETIKNKGKNIDWGIFEGLKGEELQKKIEDVFPPLLEQFKDQAELFKPEAAKIWAQLFGIDEQLVIPVLYKFQHGSTDAGDPGWKIRAKELIQGGLSNAGLKYDENTKSYYIDIKTREWQFEPTKAGGKWKEEAEAAKFALNSLNADMYKTSDEMRDALDKDLKTYDKYIELAKDTTIDFLEFAEQVKQEFNMTGIFANKKDALEYLTIAKEVTKTRRELLFGKIPEKTPHGRSQSMKSEYQAMIDVIRELDVEFNKLRKDFNKEDTGRWVGAQNRILDSFAKKLKDMPKAFRDAFKVMYEKDLEKLTNLNIDFTTKEGTVAALEGVRSILEAAKKASKITQKEYDELLLHLDSKIKDTKLEIELELKAREDERLKAQVQKMFDDYNLTIELDKLGVDADEVGKLFNIDTKDLLTLEKKLESMKEEFVGRNMEKEYRQFMRKIVEINDKANLEMAKKYVKYLREEYNERAKIELEYMRQRAEVYALPFAEEETSRILDNLQKETQKKLDEIDWKTFQGSDTYIELFEDLGRVSNQALTTMLEKMRELKGSLSNLSPTELKAITDQMQKLQDEMLNRNPFNALAQSIREFRNFRGSEDVISLINIALGQDPEAEVKNFKKALDEAIRITEDKLADAQKELNRQSTLLGAAETRDKAIQKLSKIGVGEAEIDWDDKYNVDKLKKTRDEVKKNIEELRNIINAEELTPESDEQKNLLGLETSLETLTALISALESMGDAGTTDIDNIKKAWAAANGDLKLFQTNLERLKKGEKILKDQQKAVIKLAQDISDAAAKWKGAFDSIMDNLDYLGGATDGLTEAWKEFGDTVFDTITGALGMIPTLVAGFTTAGLEINAAMGIIGLIAEAIQLVITLITALAKVHDARIEKKIQNIQKSCDKLKKTIDELTEAFDNLYNEDKLREFDAAIIKSRELYIANLNAMIEAERQKKKVDQEQIDGWLDEIDDANKEMQEGIENFYESLGGFGSAANMKSTVEEWTDAWYEAFKETGDGLSGLEDSFEEFFENIVKKTLMNNIMAKYFGEDFLAGLETILGTEGGVMGNLDALNDWINQYHDLAVQADEELQAATQAIQNVTGIGGGLEGLQAGLQGMTEETADILAAYLNSVRFYVADNNQLLQNLYNVMSIDNNSNPMLQQLKIVAAQTTSINLLLDSVVHSGGYQGNGGGSYLKVHAILES